VFWDKKTGRWRSQLGNNMHKESQHSAQHCMHDLRVCRGVFWDKKTGRWRSQLGYNNRKIFMGYFNTPEEAGAAYDAKAVEIHGRSGERVVLLASFVQPPQLKILLYSSADHLSCHLVRLRTCLDGGCGILRVWFLACCLYASPLQRRQALPMAPKQWRYTAGAVSASFTLGIIGNPGILC
jgi:hypothetical protein